MKHSHLLTFRKVTRVMYFLGVIFLLAGLFLSMINIPVQAGAADTTTSSATRLPPGGLPPVQPPSGGGSNPPLQPPARQPGSGPSIPGNSGNLSNLSRNNSVLPNRPSLSRLGVMAALPTYGVHFIQNDYCYAGAAGSLTATAIVSLPDGVTGDVQMSWYEVHPNTTATVYEDHPGVKNGDVLTITAQWPGIGGFIPGVNIVEIHFGARLTAPGLTGDVTGGLDVFYNGTCAAGLPMTLGHTCVAQDGTITWNLHNPSTNSVKDTYFSYTVDGNPGGAGTIPPGGDATFSTSGGVHTVVVSYYDGLGVLQTVSDSSPATCGVPLPLQVSHTCSPDKINIVWTISNPNPFPVSWTWNLDSGAQTGSSSTVTAPSNVAHTLVVTPSVGNAVSNSSTANECGTPDTISLSHACSTDKLNIEWTVTAPSSNSAAVSFTYKIDSDTPVSASVTPGNKVTFTAPSNVAHTVTVSWSGGPDLVNTSTANECGVPVVTLSLVKSCTTDNTGSVQWFVHNPSTTQSVDFKWSLDGATPTSGTAAPGNTLLTTTTNGAHKITITWGTNGTDELSSTAGECATIPNLEISFHCGEPNGGIDWIVTDPATTGSPVAFTWDLDNGALKGTGTVNPGGVGVHVTTSTAGAHTLTIFWNNNQNTASKTSLANSCTQTKPVDLSLSFACTASGIQWTVKNTNAVAMSFTWSIDGSGSTSGTVAKNGKTTFLTTKAGEKHTVTITWSNGNGGTSSASVKDSGTTCSTSGPQLNVSYTCILGTNQIQWKVTNGGGSSTAYTWSSDDGQAGSGSVGAGNSSNFLVTGSGKHTITVSYGGVSTSATSSDTSCLLLITRTVTPTPTATATATPGFTATPTQTKTAMPTVGIPSTGNKSAASGGNVLAPKGGADLTGAFDAVGLWHNLLITLGLLFLGIAMVSEGVLKKLN